MKNRYEVHVWEKGNPSYKDGKCEISTISTGSGHGEDIIFIVEDTNLTSFITFRYARYNYSVGRYLKEFKITINEFTMSKLPSDTIFQTTKEFYIDDELWDSLIPTVCSQEYYNLIDALMEGKKDKEVPLSSIENEIFNILKQIYRQI